MFNRSIWESWRQDLNRRSEHLTFQFNSLLWGGLAICIGCAIAIIVALLLPVSTDGLEEAKRLGIVSGTILADYPDDHDTKIYIVSLILALPLSFLAWCALAWRATRSALPLNEYNQNDASAPESTTSYVPVSRSLLWCDFIVIPILLVCLTYDGRFFTEANYTFTLLAEEGQFIDWVQKLHQGRIFHQDGFSLYGPLMVYPLVWLEELFGSSLMVLRIYRFVLDVLAYMLFYFVLLDVTGRRKIAIVGILIFVGFYYPWFSAPNGTMLRIVIGLLPILLCYRWFNTRQIRFLIGAGITSALIVFYSQEVGAGTTLAVLAMLVFSGFQETWRQGLHAIGIFFISFFIGAMPVIISFAQMGALQALFMNLTEYPKLAMLGYSAFPFPSLISAFEKMIANPGYVSLRSFIFVFFVSYGPILLYTSIILLVAIRWLIKRSTSFDAILFGLACFGLVYYRSALGRSWGKSGTVFPPALILSIILLWWLWHLGRHAWAQPRVHRRLIYIYTSAVGLILAGLLSYSLWVTNFSIKIGINRTFHKVIDAPTYWTQSGWQPFSTPYLAGLYGPPAWVDRLEAITSFIQSRTQPDEYIYVFPNEPMYYRLLNRPNPTRWGNAYNAITSAHRRSIVEDLERTKPQWVLYSMDTWRLDMIPEEIQVPEITAYLTQYYELDQIIGKTHLLKRRQSSPPQVE